MRLQKKESINIDQTAQTNRRHRGLEHWQILAICFSVYDFISIHIYLTFFTIIS